MHKSWNKLWLWGCPYSEPKKRSVQTSQLWSIKLTFWTKVLKTDSDIKISDYLLVKSQNPEFTNYEVSPKYSEDRLWKRYSSFNKNHQKPLNSKTQQKIWCDRHTKANLLFPYSSVLCVKEVFCIQSSSPTTSYSATLVFCLKWSSPKNT